MAEFLTSDTHFFHNNIIKYCNRPYDSVEEMNEDLINAWNKVVGSNDKVYHLGDISFAGYDRTKEVLKRLNGKIVLHVGNHDRRKMVKQLFKDGLIEDYYEVGQYLKSNKHQMWLTHYPLEIGVRPKKWSISGHIHDNPNNFVNQINLGIDARNDLVTSRPFGEPIPMIELIEYLDSLTGGIEKEWKFNRNLE